MKIVYYSNYKETEKTMDLSGTEDQMFEEFYKMNNTLRYCNGSHWQFIDDTQDDKYRDWVKNLDKMRHFNLYYGNGVVD